MRVSANFSMSSSFTPKAARFLGNLMAWRSFFTAVTLSSAASVVERPHMSSPMFSAIFANFLKLVGMLNSIT